MIVSMEKNTLIKLEDQWMYKLQREAERIVTDDNQSMKHTFVKK